jgi:Caspase domain
MRGVTSLTEAVKQAASSGGSLTEEVKKSAREGAADSDEAVTPAGASGNGLDGRHDGSQGGRHPWGPVPTGASARWRRIAREAPAPEPRPWFSRSAGAPGPQAVGRNPIAPALRESVAKTAAGLRALGIRLAGIAAVSLLSLLVTPSAVDTADRKGAVNTVDLKGTIDAAYRKDDTAHRKDAMISTGRKGDAAHRKDASDTADRKGVVDDGAGWKDKDAVAAPQRRVALVIGNSAYRHARRLGNPRNDAVDIGAALKKHGFEVIEGFDLDKAALDAKLREFAARLRGADIGVFFYAGHGLHVAGHNYLVPVDARLMVASALELELVRLDRIHQIMEREAATNVLFFDACRDDPLSDTLARTLGTRLADSGRDLVAVRSGAGTLLSFSTQPGTLALDGKGRNSPYSGALAKQLARSHDDLAAMLIEVRNEVMRETDGRQVPWEHSALTGRFYFNAVAEAPGPGAAMHLKVREAFEAWTATRDTINVAVLNAFVARYGDTYYAALARARLEELRKSDRAPDKMPLPSFGSAAPPR